MLEKNNEQVILASSERNSATPPTNRGPSNFPTSPSGGRLLYVPKYRTAPKVVPGVGGDVELDDQSLIDEQTKLVSINYLIIPSFSIN